MRTHPKGVSSLCTLLVTLCLCFTTKLAAQTSILFDFSFAAPYQPSTFSNHTFPSCGNPTCNFDLENNGSNFSSSQPVSSSNTGSYLDILPGDDGVCSFSGPNHDRFMPSMGTNEAFIGFWFRPSPAFSDGRVLLWKSRFYFDMLAAKMVFGFITNGTIVKLTIPFNGYGPFSREYYTDGAWHHIGVNFEKGYGSQLYVDGEMIKEQLVPGAGDLTVLSPNFQELQIGKVNGSATSKYIGGIDEVLLSDKTWSCQDLINYLSGLGFSNSCPSSPGCYYGTFDTHPSRWDPKDCPLNYPNQVTPAVEQFQGFATPRYQPDHGLLHDISSSKLAGRRNITYSRNHFSCFRLFLHPLKPLDSITSIQCSKICFYP